MKKLIITILLFLVTGICYNLFCLKNKIKEKNKIYVTKKTIYKNRVNKKIIIYLQPLGDVKNSYIEYLKNSIISFYGFNCSVKNKIDFTNDILTKSKVRYDADKILQKFKSDEYVVILTEKDIACKDGIYPEWGIFGLGLCPGKTCVISTFRLKRNVTELTVMERLKKIVLHEVGHNLGLDHCKNDKKCLMNDADGTIKQVDSENIWLCNKCSKQIKNFGKPN